MDREAETDLEVIELILIRVLGRDFWGDVSIDFKNGRPIMISVNEKIRIHQTEEALSRKNHQRLHVEPAGKHERVNPSYS